MVRSAARVPSDTSDIAAAAIADPAALAPVPAERRSRLRALSQLRTFESFKSSPFRWYFVSMLGVFGAMNSQMIARGVLIYDLTGSFAALGTLALAGAIPGLALSLHGGVIADRLPKKQIQQVGNALNALNTMSIVALLLAGAMRWEYMIVNAAIQGVIQALMMPARQSMLPDIVYPRQVMNAVALNNAGMNLSRLMVPAGIGVLMEVTDYYWAFIAITGFYLFSTVTLFRVPSRPIEIPPEERTEAQARLHAAGGQATRAKSGAGFGDLIDGGRYILRDHTVRTILVINFLMVLFSMPYMQMLPGFVKEVLKGGPGLQGLLTSVTGVGSLAAALVIASLPSRRRGMIFIIGSVVLGIALIAFSWSTSVAITMPVMLLIGVGQSVRMALSNVLVQAYTEDQYRGRVMSIYMMEMSLVQVGVFGVGIAAEIIGVQWALGLCSAGLVILSVATLAMVPRMRNLD
ncbi:MAG: MFS transporter [Dehalococcoidia bacterium]|nr:MAG: MFS transporter [Dehalococcoidia bacterium]